MTAEEIDRRKKMNARQNNLLDDDEDDNQDFDEDGNPLTIDAA